MRRVASGNTLTIRIAGKDDNVSFAAFVRVQRETLQILRDLDAEMSGGQKPLRWDVVDVSLNSPLTVTISGHSIDGPGLYSTEIASAYVDGMQQLEHAPELPRHFPVDTLERAKRLVSVKNDGVASLVYSTPGRPPVEPTQHLAANVDYILKHKFYLSDTTLEGMLEVVDIHGEYEFAIYDLLNGQKIKCRFEKEMLEEVVSLLRSRVAVAGEAKFSRTGRAVSIKVRSIKRLRSAAELPQFRVGEEIDLTGGMDSAEFVRRMRDAK